KGGIFERGASNFRAIVHGLRAAGGDAAKPPPAAAPAAADLVPKLPLVIAAREGTATSTFAHPPHPHAYAPWRRVQFAALIPRDDTDRWVPATAWCEGRPDEGIGEGITIALAAPTRIDALRIAAGVWKSTKLFVGNNQITSLEVSLDGKVTAVKVPGER